MRRLPFLPAALLCCVSTVLTGAAEPTPADFQPDARSVQRYGPAYRYPQAGWIILHIEGEPYERGVQHGRLLAPEIAANIRCLAATHSSKAPADGWKLMRTLVNSLFMRRYDKEYLEEMKGIADGATSAGARFDGRNIDVVDIVAINSWPEIMTLDSALDAEPTGLECLRCIEGNPKTPVAPKPEHCSAFAAVGPATADGKIVFGHITMYSLYESDFFNVWLDVKSAKGHRVLMQSYPGGIQSGLDYYLNDAGILVSETTIAQTRFDGTGTALASRIRKALQYADSIDKAVDILKEENNGLYTNEWMLADVKTNEIAMFELGTKKTKLYRSSKNEWFGGTEGFYWGCNNTKDVDVRLETIDDLKSGRPASAVFHPSDRDRKWLELYDKYKGKIDVEFGKLAFTTPPIAAYHSVDAKFTTSDMAKELKTWALFGPPLGRTWQPTENERRQYPEVQPLVSNPWAVLTGAAPPPSKANGPAVVDLHNPENGDVKATVKRSETPETTPAWHGTLLPKTEADAWLGAAFRDYERFAAMDNAYRKASKGKLAPEDRDELAVRLYAARADYNLGARAHPEASLNDTKSDIRQGDWYRVASGKGFLRLHDLRNGLGAEKFDALMEQFGQEHGGKPTSSTDYEKLVVDAYSTPDVVSVITFRQYWSMRTELPRYKLGKVVLGKVSDVPNGKKYELTLDLHVEGDIGFDRPIEVAVQTAHGEVIKRVRVPADAHQKVALEVDDKPLRVTVDKYNLASKANGGVFTVLTFREELEQTLIVYGAGDEVNANREAADALQQAIRASHSNITVPIKSDQDVTDDELKTHHLLLIGRPDCNKITAQFAGEFPVTFGTRSFAVRGEAYAHADSAVMAAAENPLNHRYSAVVITGLDSAATLRAAPKLLESEAAEVVVLPHGRKAKALVTPAKDLVREVEPAKAGG